MKEQELRVGCVILAAGNGARFGGNKLLAEFRGLPLIEWAIRAVPAACLSRTVLVTQYEDLEALGKKRGLRVIRNDAPELGISRSVALGTAALRESCDGILFLVSDQPLLRRETVQRLIDAWIETSRTPDSSCCTKAEPFSIAALCANGVRGNPCLFPADLFPALEALTGDRGGGQIIKRCPERLLTVEAAPEELADVDTAAELLTLKSAAGQLE